MFRNIVISILAAVLIVEKVPWFRYCAMEEKIGIFIGKNRSKSTGNTGKE